MARPEPIEDMLDDLTTKQKLIVLGEKMIGFIIERTQKGQGVNGQFKGYSTKGRYPYWKRKADGKFKRQATQFKPSSPRDVNLTLTSDMLNSLKVKMNKTDDQQVTIGFPPAQAVKANSNEAQGRAISTPSKPVTEDEQRFIARYFDKEIKRSFRKASGKTEITIG